MGVFNGFCISSAIHTHSSNTYTRPERRRREDGRKKKQQLDHPPHCNSLILYFGSLMCSLSKSFLSSNLFIWIDRPIVLNGSRCYISIFDGLVTILDIKKNGSLFWLITYRARSYNMMVFVHLVSADPRQHLGWIKEIGFLLSAAVPPPKVKWPKVNQCHLSDASSPLGLRTKLKTKDFQKLKFLISLREACARRKG